MFPFQNQSNQQLRHAAPSVIQNQPLHRLAASRMFRIRRIPPLHAYSDYTENYEFQILPHAVYQDMEGLFQLMLSSMQQLYSEMETRSILNDQQVHAHILIQTHDEQPRLLTFNNPFTNQLSRVIYSSQDFGYMINEFVNSILMYFQSDETISLPEVKCFIQFKTNQFYTPLAVGAGWKDEVTQILYYLNKHKEKHGFVVIDVPYNDLNLCFWLCVTYFMHPKLQTHFRKRPIEWIYKAKLQRVHDLPDSPLPCPLIETCQKWLEKYPRKRIVIVKENKHCDFYKGTNWQPPETNQKDPHSLYFFLKLVKHANHPAHLMVIHAPNRIFCCSRQKTCVVCMKTFASQQKNIRNHIDNHQCIEAKQCSKCQMFFMYDEDWKQHQQGDASLECKNCCVPFNNKLCCERHELFCKGFYKKCDQCGKIANLNHQCGMHQCSECGEYVPDHIPSKKTIFHRCFWQRDTLPKQNKQRYFVFDFESLFEKLDNGEMVHHINFVACQELGQTEVLTWSSIDTFLDWLWSLKNDFRYPLIFYAHNLKGYDGRLLFDAVRKRLNYTPDKVMWCGTKIMAMEFNTYLCKMLFRDSLNHIQAALEQFPKIFGLDETKFEKGFFPYLFNTPEHQNYCGPVPAIQYFDPNSMSPAKKEKFLKWYDTVKNEPMYDFQAELKKYCISDVRILAESLEKYMQEGIEINQGLNPLNSNTIAAYAMKVYRTLHMPEECLTSLSPQEDAFARKAFHGGRTDVRCMLKFWTPDQISQGVYGKYQDIQSLYPYVQFFKPMPVGIPQILKFHSTENLEEISQKILNEEWFGFIECDLLCQEYLHHPVLVCKNSAQSKLTADLLPKTKITITTAECQVALKKGYQLTKVYEVHLYQKSTTLFKSYIQQYLKIKIENSGMPSWIKTDQDWTEFAEEQYTRHGIQLVKENMTKNPGKKQLAKMMLNSLWGKFAERSKYSEHVKYKNVAEYQALETKMLNCEIDFLYVDSQVENEGYCVIRSNVSNPDNEMKRRTHVALAAYVTAFGRLELWKQMDLLGDRVLYHDTDSIIYEHQPQAYNIPEGRYLGEWEDECPDQPMAKFVSLGPKTYAYAVVDKPVKDEEMCQDSIELNGQIYNLKYNCKAKGFTLNCNTVDQINFEGMRHLVMDTNHHLQTPNRSFIYDRRKGQMKTVHNIKILKRTYDKGVVFPDFKVFPFGWEQFSLEVSK